MSDLSSDSYKQGIKEKKSPSLTKLKGTDILRIFLFFSLMTYFSLKLITTSETNEEIYEKVKTLDDKIEKIASEASINTLQLRQTQKFVKETCGKSKISRYLDERINSSFSRIKSLPGNQGKYGLTNFEAEFNIINIAREDYGYEASVYEVNEEGEIEISPYKNEIDKIISASNQLDKPFQTGKKEGKFVIKLKGAIRAFGFGIVHKIVKEDLKYIKEFAVYGLKTREVK